MEKKSIFSDLPNESKKILDDFDLLVQSVRPLSSKHFQQLPKDIRQLFHLLTDNRNHRYSGYMNENATLSAYVRYYQWWNLVRLTQLFAGLGSQAFHIPDEGICLDLGSGPLTVPIAMWLACPELRYKRIHWYCVDSSQLALSFGEDLFLAVVAKTVKITGKEVEPWRITRIKGEFGTKIRSVVNFVSCANLFNELVQTSGKPPEYTAKRGADALVAYTANNGSLLVVEPGTPPSMRFLSAFRGAMLRKNWQIVSPCPHSGDCPMEGKRGGKWCHFSFSTEKTAVPAKLKKLSVDAGLPKERASLSFILAQSQKNRDPLYKNVSKKTDDTTDIDVRITSEAIALPNSRVGYYGCSKVGLVLIAKKDKNFSLDSGELISAKIPQQIFTDKKSGAILLEP